MHNIYVLFIATTFPCTVQHLRAPVSHVLPVLCWRLCTYNQLSFYLHNISLSLYNIYVPFIDTILLFHCTTFTFLIAAQYSISLHYITFMCVHLHNMYSLISVADSMHTINYSITTSASSNYSSHQKFKFTLLLPVILCTCTLRYFLNT
jgi:hypothetical protein